MAKVMKIKKVEDRALFGGGFDVDMTSLLSAFRVSNETAAKLHSEGFVTFFDLANLVDDFGYALRDKAADRFYAFAQNSGQWNTLRIMLLKFAYLFRPGSDFDYDKEADIYERDLSTVTAIEEAWLKCSRRREASTRKGEHIIS
jgi:hypothetical protein